MKKYIDNNEKEPMIEIEMTKNILITTKKNVPIIIRATLLQSQFIVSLCMILPLSRAYYIVEDTSFIPCQWLCLQRTWNF